MYCLKELACPSGSVSNSGRSANLEIVEVASSEDLGARMQFKDHARRIGHAAACTRLASKTKHVVSRARSASTTLSERERAFIVDLTKRRGVPLAQWFQKDIAWFAAPSIVLSKGSAVGFFQSFRWLFMGSLGYSSIPNVGYPSNSLTFRISRPRDVSNSRDDACTRGITPSPRPQLSDQARVGKTENRRFRRRHVTKSSSSF